MRKVFSHVPEIQACILIVQHLPAHIAPSICKSIQRTASMPVKLAEDGDVLTMRQIYIAPGNVHTTIKDNQFIKLVDGSKVNFVRPSIDVAMKSLKQTPELQSFGVILTGMGDDGVEGLHHIKSLGGIAMAQDENSCVVYGMPKAAAAIGVHFILSPEEIGNKITQIVRAA